MKYRRNKSYSITKQNESRADWAEHALAVGTDRAAERDGEDARTDVSDLLANVRHFCDRAGIDWPGIVDHADNAYIGDSEDGPYAKRDSRRFP